MNLRRIIILWQQRVKNYVQNVLKEKKILRNGIEIDPKYYAIAKRRIDNTQEQLF